MATSPDYHWSTPYARPHRPAERGRRMIGTFRTTRNANSINIQDGSELEQIIQDQTRNFPLVESWLSAWTGHTAGTGIWPDFAVENLEERRALRQWFRRWNKRADADGMTTLHGLTALVARKVAQDGEVFARFRFRFPEDGLETPLQIQLIRAAQLPRHKTDGGQGGNEVVGGIEFTPFGQRVAYHFYRRDPGETNLSGIVRSNLDTVRVPSDQVLHIGLPQDVGEHRHVSILRSALLTLKSMADTNENTIERLRVLSLFTALFTLPLDENDPPRFLGAGDPNSEGSAMTYELEPGSLSEAPPGATVQQMETPDVGSTYIDFIRNQTQNLAAMLGIVYPELSGDYNSITLSSLRAGIVAARRRHSFFTQHCLVDQWLARVMPVAIQTAVVSNALTLSNFATNPEEYDDILWRGQREEYIDPETESNADRNRLDNLQIAFSDLQDGDPESVFRRIAEDREMAARFGVSFDTDPRQPQVESPTSNASLDADEEDEG